MNHGVWQLLVCFLVGLLVIGGSAAILFGFLVFLGRFDRPVELWFERHSKIGKAVQVVCIAFILAAACYVFVAVGCGILGKK